MSQSPQLRQALALRQAGYGGHCAVLPFRWVSQMFAAKNSGPHLPWMAEQRFEMKEAPAGWTVIDRHTEQPVEVEEAWALDLVDLLNAAEIKRKITRGHIV